MITTCSIPLIQNALRHPDRLAIIDQDGRHTYGDLLNAARAVADTLLENRPDLEESRIAFLVPPRFEYVATQWAIWLAGGIAVPLSGSHPLPELRFVLEDSGAEVLVGHPEVEARLRPLAQELRIPLLTTAAAPGARWRALPVVPLDRRAMILYTSGTTSKPKGVVTTHRILTAQITSLVSAWGWEPDDHILNVLPLSHVHGIINVLSCALWAGACCEMLPRFEPARVWDRFMEGRVTLFMAVPTIYVKLLDAWENASAENQRAMSRACGELRLMVSGSAPLPVGIFNQWKAISGHTLLERYGMTEIGMALSNPLRGERRPGSVGQPLPGVSVELADESGCPIEGENETGEILVKGPNVFLEYWQRPEATRASFRDGWFLTGDMAILEKGYYRILGRTSVDIIKTGGYKVSALEIEEVLRTHPDIEECAVTGLADPEWGERVSAAVILRAGRSLSLADLRAWAKERLAGYKVPARLVCLDELPRNLLGKVTKPELKKLFESMEEI